MSTGTSGTERDERRRQEAAKWYVERRSKSRWWPTPAAWRWRKWSANADNMVEYLQCVRLNMILREIPSWPTPTDEELRAAASKMPSDVVRVIGASEAKGQFAGAWHAVPRARQALVALSFVILLAIAAVLIGPRVPNLIDAVTSRADTYHTGRGERLVVHLEDHSQINLGVETQLNVRFSAQRRYVFLSSGEALFTVAHDLRRPFEVDAGTARIMDLGTQFIVRRYHDKQVAVAVSEGAVAVAPLAQRTNRRGSDPGRGDSGVMPGSVTVTKGEEVSSDANGVISPASPTDAQALASWLFGSRTYREKPLGQVIEDVRRYTPRLIEYDRGVGALLFNGFVDQNKAEQWVRGLPTTFPVTIDDSDPRRLVIHCELPDCEQP